MKRYTSILMVLARSSFCWVLLILAGTAALEFVLPDLHRWWFAIALVYITSRLSVTGCDFGGRQHYLWQRLRVGPMGQLMVGTGYNFLCYLLMWGVQAGLAVWMLVRQGFSGHQLYLELHTDSFLHSLLPLSEPTRYLRNLVMFLVLALASAAAPQFQRRGGVWYKSMVLAVVCGWAFPWELGGMSMDLMWITLLVIAAMVMLVLVRGEEFKYEADS